MGNRFKERYRGKRGQVTVFIIIAIIIVVGVIGYMIFRNTLMDQVVPKDLEPVYAYYLGCIEEEARLGAIIMGEQAGYIEPPDFNPGSSYMPFSNQLDFMGIGVPYWYYVSGNGVVGEQVPDKSLMEDQLGDFIEEGIGRCDFSSFVDGGFEIRVARDVDVKTKIEENKIIVSVNQDLSIKTDNVSWTGNSHLKDVNSNLGVFYDLSKKIYDNFMETMFLENYGVDILRLYAPVDGVEIGCNSLIWSVGEVRENLTRALEANIGFIKVEGDYYELSNEENKYFVNNIGESVDANVNFLYLREWPMKAEVWPSEGGLMKADPVGLQEGLGMLGFCYVPYHFVYDFAYPVMIQTYYEGEIFQFPVVVYINKNNPREPIEGEGLPNVAPQLCEHRNSEISVYTYDRELNPVEADISFKCFDTSCNIGRTIFKEGEAVLVDDFPQCVNGYVIANAEGYETGKYVVSSVSENSVSLVLDRKYKLDLEIKKAGGIIDSGDYAVVVFEKDGVSRGYNYPQQKKAELSEGEYEIKVYIYSNTYLKLEGGDSMRCVEVPKSGFLGIFGATEEKCFDLNVPDQEVEVAVSGGGTQNHYIAESELVNSKKIIIDAQSFGSVSKIEDLQTNYNNIDISRLNVRFE